MKKGWLDNPEDDFLNSLINQKQTTSVDNTTANTNMVSLADQQQAQEFQRLALEQQKREQLEKNRTFVSTPGVKFPQSYKQKLDTEKAQVWKEGQAERDKINGPLSTIGMGMGVLGGLGAAAVSSPLVAAGLTGAFAVHGLNELPSTIDAWKDPKVSAWDATTKTAWNALDFAPLAPGILKGGKLATEAVKASKESGLLSNTYKINPWAFKPNPEMGYRMLGKEGYVNALKEQALTAKPIPNAPNDGSISLLRNTNRNPNTGKMQGALDRPYFADGVVDERYASDYMAAVNKAENNLVPIPGHKGIAPSKAGSIPLENATLYKKNWLQGYKEVPKPSIQASKAGVQVAPNFKSEIDWAKWNKEIPSNKTLLDEYNSIEQSSKANGTWMKNPDGSAFQGTPEQFVQQNSSNFKKAFPNGNDITYRGSTNQMSKKGFLNEDKVSGSIFTANKEAAISYGPGKRGYNEGAIFKKTEDTGNKVHELYYPTSKNSINIDNQGRSWRELSKDIIPRPEDYIDKYGDLKSAYY